MKYLTDMEQIKLQYHHKLTLKKKEVKCWVLHLGVFPASCEGLGPK